MDIHDIKYDPNLPDDWDDKKEWVEPDPLTGGEQTVITRGKNFMMVIPHEGLTPERIAEIAGVPVDQVKENIQKMRNLYSACKWEYADPFNKIRIWQIPT